MKLKEDLISGGSKIWRLPSLAFDVIARFFKKKYYGMLSVEDLDKIVQEKEEEIKDLELMESEQLEEIKNEMRIDLARFGYDEEEIEEMIETSLGEGPKCQTKDK